MKLRVAVALAATLILSACYPPVTKNPVGVTAGIRPDKALIGLWEGEGHDHKRSYFHFLPKSDGSIEVIIVEENPVDADVTIAMVTTATLGANRYMNARLVSNGVEPETDQPPGTVPVLYRIDAKGTLTLAMMDETATKAAIDAHKIKGTTGKGGTDDAVITADPKALDAFMRSAAAVALFETPFFTLHKVK